MNSNASPWILLVPDLVTTLICPPLKSPYSASKLLVITRNCSIESRFGMIAATLCTASWASAPFTMNPLAPGRPPSTDWVPGFKLPETDPPPGDAVSPLVLEYPVIGETPGCRVRRLR